MNRDRQEQKLATDAQNERNIARKRHLISTDYYYYYIIITGLVTVSLLRHHSDTGTCSLLSAPRTPTRRKEAEA